MWEAESWARDDDVLSWRSLDTTQWVIDTPAEPDATPWDPDGHSETVSGRSMAGALADTLLR